jgi:hypothetical protein
MLYLKQSTLANVLVGPAIDITDVTTPLTGLTIHPADIHLSKNGGALTDKSEATNCTHDSLGYYSCPLNTTDTNTLGRLQLVVVEASAFPIYAEYMVVTANVYDTLCSTDALDVEVTTKTGFALSAAGVDAVLDEVIENTLTLRQAIMLIKAVCAGKSSGGGSPTILFRNDLDTLNRVSATVDSAGNRTAVTKDVTP